MIHLGDITKIDGSKILPVDVIIGGSPCQDLSIAGKREGLSGERSGLFMEQIRVIKEMHKEYGTSYPRFMVWENVPGALSSNKGEDFRIVLEETAKIAEPDTVIPGPPKGKWRNNGCIVGDRWSIAWRILDAQFWGVPQRRRRIALVSDFRGESAHEILFECKSVPRDFEKGGTAWEGVTANAERSAGISSDERKTINTINTAYSFDSLSSNSMKSKNPYSGCRPVNIAKTLDTTYPDPSKNQGGIAIVETHIEIYDCRGNGEGKIAPTITGDHNSRVTDYTGCIVGTETYCLQGNGIDRSETAGCNGKGWKKDTSYTLNTVDRHAIMCMAHGQANAEVLRNLSPTLNCDHEQPIVMSVYQNGDEEVRVGEVANTLNTNSNASGRNAPVIFENHQLADYRQGVGTLKASGGDCVGGSENLCISCLTGWDRQARRVYSNQGVIPTLSAREVSGQNQQAVLTEGVVAGFNSHKSITGSIQYKKDVAPTLESNMPSNVLKGMLVRRLTPLECERLQGFPDGWTDIGDYTDSNGKKKKSSDTARYKALGNSIALPPWRWVLKRLCNQYDRFATMGSLFDGIGGFPLIWEEINGKGSCLWASEIEEFPIAVTKTRFSQ